MTQALPMSQWLKAGPADDRIVLRDGARCVSLRSLRDRVAGLAARLQARPEQRWALCFDNGGAFLVALLATLHAERTPIIPGNMQQASLEEQRACFEAVLSDQPALCVAFPGLFADLSMLGESVPLTPMPADAALELFTSGSTGTPRQVIKTIAVMDCEAAWLADRFGEILAGCHVVASVTHQHLYGLTFRIMLPMAMGLSLDAQRIRYPEQLSALGQDQRLAFISSPAFLKRLDPGLDAPVLCWVLSAGGVLEANEARAAAHWLGVALHEIYGSTETGVLAWRAHDQDDLSWRPFPAVRFLVDGDGWRVSSPLIASSEGLVLEDRLVFDAASGWFRLLGRRDRIVKIEEKRVSLNEVERRVCALEGIADAVAVYLDQGGRQGVGMVVTLDASGAARWANTPLSHRRAEWRRQLSSCLDPVAVPRYWRVVPSIPCNGMGKRVQAQLQELFA
jgi:acyl-coenzyme A synthetase/AMP-(fatty) acid ligase